MKLDIELPDGIDISGMLDNEMTNRTELVFKGKEAIYQDVKGDEPEDKEISSDDGSFRMVLRMDDMEEIRYLNFEEKKSLHQTAFMGKDFLIESDIEKPKWKLTNEKIKYLGFVCQKAEMTREGESEGEEERIVAWFTSEIPVPLGPSGYNSLPGAILMINVDDGQTEIKATEVSLESISQDQLKRPTKGKRVSPEEFDRIVEEKTKEMEREFSGSEGGSIIIRG